MQYEIKCENCAHETYCLDNGYTDPVEKQGVCNPDHIFVLKDELRNKEDNH